MYTSLFKKNGLLKLIILIAAVGACILAMAQTPQKVSYQAVARNGSGVTILH